MNEKAALAEFVRTGGFAVMVVSGGKSMVQEKLAGVASVLVAASVAWTWKVWLASLRLLKFAGEVQAVKAPLSIEHSNMQGGSSQEKLKEASRELLGSGGFESMKVSGAIVSTVQLAFAGVRSLLPARSIARTWKE